MSTDSPIRWRLRSAVVDAIQWTGSNEQAVAGLAPAAFHSLDEQDRANSDDPDATASLLEGLHCSWVLVYTGDWVVKDAEGRLSVVRDSDFIARYEPDAAVLEVPNA